VCNPAPDPSNGCKNSNNSTLAKCGNEDAVFYHDCHGMIFYGGKKDTMIYIALGASFSFMGCIS
jgi:hypothetical protein